MPQKKIYIPSFWLKKNGIYGIYIIIYPYHILTMLFLTLQSLDLWLTLAVKAKRCFDRCELFQFIRLAFFFR